MYSINGKRGFLNRRKKLKISDCVFVLFDQCRKTNLFPYDPMNLIRKFETEKHIQYELSLKSPKSHVQFVYNKNEKLKNKILPWKINGRGSNRYLHYDHYHHYHRLYCSSS